MVIAIFILMMVSLMIFTSYVISMVNRFGIPESISDTYYLLKNEHNGREWLFTIAMLLTAFPLMPAFIECSTIDYTQLLAWLPCAALSFVGCAPEFKHGLDRIVHISATVICALSSQAWVAIYDTWLLLIWIIPAIGLLFKAVSNILKNKKDRRLSQYPTYWSRPLMYRAHALFWIELTAFGVTFLALFM